MGRTSHPFPIKVGHILQTIDSGDLAIAGGTDYTLEFDLRSYDHNGNVALRIVSTSAALVGTGLDDITFDISPMARNVLDTAWITEANTINTVAITTTTRDIATAGKALYFDLTRMMILAASYESCLGLAGIRIVIKNAGAGNNGSLRAFLELR